jgi:tetratricopeptide (TPR) repeat protein
MTSPAYQQSSKIKGMELLYSKKKYDAAILQFEKALSICHDDENGKEAELHNLIGCALFRKKDYSAALEAFEIAVGKATSSSTRQRWHENENNHPTTAVSDLGWTFYRMGKCFHELGEHEAAAVYLARSTSIFQFNSSSHLESSSSQTTNSAMARKLRSTLALSKSKRAARRSRRENSIVIKEDADFNPTERMFDTEPQVDGDDISSKASRKDERGDTMNSKSVTFCTIPATGSLSSAEQVELVCDR